MQAFSPASVSDLSMCLVFVEGVWPHKATLIYEVALGLILLTPLVYGSSHMRAPETVF